MVPGVAEAAGGIIKGLGDTVLNWVKEFHMDPAAAAELTLKTQQATLDAQRQLLELEKKDVDSARNREIQTADPTTRRLAYLYTGGYFSIIGACWYWGIPSNAHDTLVTLLGILTAAQTAIIGYYFGSSHGSASKDQTIQAVTKRAINLD